MSIQPTTIGELIARRMTGQSLSACEETVLQAWACESDANLAAYQELLQDNWAHPAIQRLLDTAQRESWNAIAARLGTSTPFSVRPRPTKAIIYRRLVGLAAALITALLIAYWLWPATARPPKDYTLFPPVLTTLHKSVILYASGEQTPLDSAGNGPIPAPPGITIEKIGTATIRYGSSKNSSYNAVLTATGRQCHLFLPDNTEVWLNTESALRFPVRFPSDRRQVELRGQAYFKVQPDAKRPFSIVTSPLRPSDSGLTVQVLGTTFDCQAYPGDTSLLMTLLEGAVQISHNRQAVTLTAPRVAYLGTTHGWIGLRDADHYVDWRDSLHFDFENAPLYQVLEQWSHWYHVALVCPGDLLTKWYVSGSFEKSNPLDNNLKILATGLHIRCRRQRDTVYMESRRLQKNRFH